MTSKPRNRAVLRCVLFLLGLVAEQLHAEDLTADEILERNRKAMAPPIQYRITTGRVENVVSIKQIAGVGLAVRMDSVTPRFERGSLALGSEYWTWDSGTKTGSKLTDAMAAAQAGAMRLAAAVRDAAPEPAVRCVVREPVSREGRRCLVVDEVVPDAFVEAAMKGAPPGARIPRGTRYVVDSQSFVTVETAPLEGSPDTAGEATVVSDVRVNAELSDELFLPPDGYAFTTPGSLREAYDEADRHYLEKAEAAMAARAKEIDAQIRRDMQDDPIRRDPVTGEILRDPKTGHAILRAPPGFSEEEYNREVTRIVMEHRLHSGNDDPVDPVLIEKIMKLDASRSKGPANALPLPPAPVIVPPEPVVEPVRRSWVLLVNVAVVLLLAGWSYWRFGRRRS